MYLTHILSLSMKSHWYVSGYNLGFENFEHGGNMENLFSDVGADATMFRIVCKSNLTRSLAEDLTERFVEVLNALDSLKDGYQSLHSLKEAIHEDVAETALSGGMTMKEASGVVLAAGKWVGKARASIKERDEAAVQRRKMTRRRSISHAVC